MTKHRLTEPRPLEPGTWLLKMNDMRGNSDIYQTVAAGTRTELAHYVEQERVEPYTDGHWGKCFRKGGPLEWFNGAARYEPWEPQPTPHYPFVEAVEAVEAVEEGAPQSLNDLALANLRKALRVRIIEAPLRGYALYESALAWLDRLEKERDKLKIERDTLLWFNEQESADALRKLFAERDDAQKLIDRLTKNLATASRRYAELDGETSKRITKLEQTLKEINGAVDRMIDRESRG